MRISIHQPAYLPFLGYIEKMKNTDIFIYLDTVAYSKNSFDNRNKILIDGKEKWLTIPIKTAGKLGQTYLEAIPDNFNWLKTHIYLIDRAYSGSKGYIKYMSILRDTYENCYSTVLRNMGTSYDMASPSLSDICWWLLGFYEEAFSIRSQAVVASTKQFEGKGSDLILDICKKLGATEYYSGIMGHDYLKEDDFKKAGIKIVYQTYKPPHNLAAIHSLFTEI